MPNDVPHQLTALILLADTADSELVKGTLEGSGFRVLQAASLAEARRFLAADREALPAGSQDSAPCGIDLVITSCELADGRGEELLTELRKLPEYRFLPVIFVLEGYEEKRTEVLTAAGADEYLLKPIKRESILLRSRLLAKVGAERRALLDALEEARHVAEVEENLAARARLFVEEILASISSLVIVVDEERQIHFMNRRARDFFGVKDDMFSISLGERESSLLGLLGEEFFSQPQVEHVLSIALESAERGRLDSLEVKGADGRSIIADMQIAPVEMGDAAHFAIALDDVTQRWQAEQELLVEKMKLEDVVNVMGASLCLVDRQGTIFWHNRTFAEWFGEPRGRQCWQAFKERPQACPECVMEEVFNLAVPASEDWRVFDPQGRCHAYQSHITPIRSPSGGTDAALILTQNVTQQFMRMEQLGLLQKLGFAIETNLELERLLHMVLTMVTAGHALGFNRAFLFLLDPDGRTLRGRMALGPTSRQEAFHIWAELADQPQDFQHLLEMADKPLSPGEMPLSQLILEFVYDIYADTNILVDAVTKGEMIHVVDAWSDPRVSEDIRERFHAKEFIAVSLNSKGRSLGVLVADNLYNERPIAPDDIDLLKIFSQQAAQGIANAISFEQLRETIEELNATRQQLVESERLAAIGKTAAFVAHEIRNPLATIGGWAHSILKKPGRKERALEAGRIILEETVRLEAMLKGVMDFARPTKPIFTVEELNPIVRVTLKKLSRILDFSNVELHQELAEDLPRVKIDASQIEQVLLNLLKNAGEAIGDRQGNIYVRTWRDGDEFVAIGVEDDGGGIPQEVAERIFDPFYTTKHGGSGLGLAVSRGIIASHRGSLDVLNTPGVGVNMVIRLLAGEVVG